VVNTHSGTSSCGLMFTSFSAMGHGSSRFEMKQRLSSVLDCNLVTAVVGWVAS